MVVPRLTQQFLLAVFGLLVTLLVCWGDGLASAQDSGSLIDLAPVNDAPLNLLGRVSYTIDTSGTANLDDIRQRPEDAWHHNAQKNNLGILQHPAWLRITLSNHRALGEPTYLRLSYPHIDVLDVYFMDGDRLIHHDATGDQLPFDSRPVDTYRHFLFPLQLDGGDTQTLYVRLRSNGYLSYPLDILTQAQLAAEEQGLSYFFGFYFGVLCIMLVFNSMIFLFVRETSYLFYLLHVVIVAAHQFCLQGFAGQYWWPEQSWLTDHTILSLTCAAGITAQLFVMRFLDVWHQGSRLDKSLAGVVLLFYAVMGVSALVVYTGVQVQATYVSLFASTLIIIYLGIKFSIRGLRSARILTAAWCTYLVFVIWAVLDRAGIINPSFISQNAVMFGSMLEYVLLSIAFASRLNDEKEKRLIAQKNLITLQAEMNENLEAVVKKRTEELELANQQLHAMSITDMLTGLNNRRYFDDMFLKEYLRAYRERTCLSVLMIDIDHFKSLNDRYGHRFGDQCLRRTGELIANSVRRPPDVAARYGGEEFVILLPNTTAAGAEVVAEKIRNGIAHLPVCFEEQPVVMTVSVGVASIIPNSRDAHAAETLIAMADQNLYTAKAEGRNRVVAA